MKNRKLIFNLISVILISFVFVFVGCKQKDKDVVKIGVILPLTGDFSNYGIQCKNGIEYAATNYSNVELVFVDSKGETKTAITAYTKLVNQEKVDIIIGDMFSNTTLALAPLANKDKVLLISPTASSKDIQKNGIYSLSVFPSEDYEGKYLAEYCNDNYKKIGIISENVAASEAMKNSFVKNFKHQIVFSESFNSDIQSFRNLLEKYRKSEIDAIFLITYSNHAINIVKQLYELDMKPEIIGQSALFDPNFIEKLNFLENKFVTTGPSFSEFSQDKEVLSFFTEYQKSMNEKPNQMSSQGYVACIVGLDFLSAIKKQEYNKEFILNYEKNTIIGKLKFSGNLSIETGLSVYCYENNSLSLVK